MSEQDWQDEEHVDEFSPSDSFEENTTDVELTQNDDGDVIFVTDNGTEVNLSSPPLSADEARNLTNHIKSTAEMLYVLIARAHAGRAWSALGYNSFEAYVRAEFDMSRSRAYQLLNQNTVVEAISAAAPEGTEFHITEAAARDLKSILGDVVPEVATRTEGLSPDEAGDVIEELIRSERDKKNMTGEFADLGDFGDFDDLDDELSDDRDGFSASSMGKGMGNGNYDGPRFSDVEEGDLDDLDDIDLDAMDDLLTFDEDPQEVRRNYDAVYVLYTVLNMMKDLPPVDGVINMIPAERRVQVESSLNSPVDWLNEFREKWNAQEWRKTEDSEEVSEENSSEDSLPIEQEQISSANDFVVDEQVEDIFSDFNAAE